MPSVDELKIEVSADTGNLTEKLAEATEALNAFAEAADRVNAALAKLSAGHRVEVKFRGDNDRGPELIQHFRV